MWLHATVQNTVKNLWGSLLILLLPNLVWCMSSGAGVSCEKVGLLFKVTVKVRNFNECSSRQYLLNCWIFCYQAWSEWNKKKMFVIFKVKITASAHTFKIWLFLPYILNCRSFCYQNKFGGTSSQAKMSCEKIGFFMVKVTVQGSKLHWMCVSPIFSVPLIVFQPK